MGIKHILRDKKKILQQVYCYNPNNHEYSDGSSPYSNKWGVPQSNDAPASPAFWIKIIWNGLT